MTAWDVAAQLGGVRNGAGWLCRCPLPSHGRGKGDKHPSLSLRDGDDGRLLVHCHAGCDPVEILKALEGGPVARRDRATPPPDDDEERRKRALKLWRETKPAAGTLVDAYLRKRDIYFAIPPEIRFHPSLPYYEGGTQIGSWPAMVVRLDDDRYCVGVQRIYLNGDHKAPVAAAKKILGIAGRAWMGPVDAREIIVGEGVETVLAASELGGRGPYDWDDPIPEPVRIADRPPPTPFYGLTPVACISANGLAKFKAPWQVTKMFICVDDDKAGVEASEACRQGNPGVECLFIRKGEV